MSPRRAKRVRGVRARRGLVGPGGRRVAFKFYDHLASVSRATAGLAIATWGTISERFEGVRVVGMFPNLNRGALDELMARAHDNDPSYQVPNLHTYRAILCPPSVDAKAVAQALGESDDVEWAYVEGGATPPPQVNPADDPRQVNQGYEDPAPDGIDAEYAWTVAGGHGENIGFVDLERGWTLDHEDLKAAGITATISGANSAFFGHGTAALGVVRGVDNTLGIVGIAPKCTARVVSQHQPTGYSTAGAIASALYVMSFGDVLLLEAQTKIGGAGPTLPVEVEQAEFDVIRLATAVGVIVVEAAGNGGRNLDTWADAAGAQPLNRASAAFRDSGAIMVGAATSAYPHARRVGSNFGSRIDCYGWGENVDTTGDGWMGTATTDYTSSFHGTSSAVAIVAGAAVCVQGAAAASGFRYSPLQMRSVLANPVSGTPSAHPISTPYGPPADLIGVMPNLRKILQDDLGVAPDVYMRDHVGDDGAPHTGSIASSPDIILRPNAEMNPQGSFGQGSGAENSDTLGAQVEVGHDNFVYVRVLNRGGSAAANVSATVYWAPVATLVTPNLWTQIGSVLIPSVPAGNQLTVSNAIVWSSAAIPGAGHYCLVGLVGTAADPAPLLADLNDWTTFERFIRENNNVTWRNINVVSNVPPPSSARSDAIRLAFMAVGAPRTAVVMQLSVVGRLPEGARLTLLAPDHLLDSLRVPRGRVPRRRKSERHSLIPLNPHGRSDLGHALFPADVRYQLELLAAIPEQYRVHTYEVSVRQSYQGAEVGRVTWLIGPEREGAHAVRRKG